MAKGRPSPATRMLRNIDPYAVDRKLFKSRLVLKRARKLLDSGLPRSGELFKDS